MASLADIENLRNRVSSPCDWKVGATTSLAEVRGLGTGAFLAGAWRIRAAMSLAGSLSGTQASLGAPLVPMDLLRSSQG